MADEYSDNIQAKKQQIRIELSQKMEEMEQERSKFDSYKRMEADRKS